MQATQRVAQALIRNIGKVVIGKEAALNSCSTRFCAGGMF